jgi:hypothetical protein
VSLNGFSQETYWFGGVGWDVFEDMYGILRLLEWAVSFNFIGY